MSLKLLSRNKEIRDLIRTARGQGWWVKRLKNNHLRWIPPKGPFVHSSANINRVRDLAKIKHDLEEAGLVLGTIYVEKPKPVEQAPVPVEVIQPTPAPVVVAEVPPEPPPVEESIQQPVEVLPMAKKKTAGRGETRKAVLDHLKLKWPTNLSVQQIYEGMRSKVPSTTRASVFQTLYALEKEGMVEKVRKGVYKAKLDEKPQTKPNTTSRKPLVMERAVGDMEELQRAMDLITEGMSALEQAVGRVGEKLAMIEQMQKMFGK